MMELRQLQYAAKVAEESSFSRAADKLHIAQPSLSQQIAKLEQELGTQLFDRSSSPVQMTYAGELFVEKAGRILDLVQELQKEMQDVANLQKGRLIIGSLPITGAHLLPGVLPIFQKQYPGTDVVLIEETTLRLEELTAKGGTDISLLTLPLADPGLAYVPILTEQIVLAVPPGHRLAAGKSRPVHLPEVEGEPFILLKRGQGFRQLVIELCRTAGFTPKIVFETSNIETARSLVAAGMGLTFVPEMVASTEGDNPQPVYMRLEGSPSRTIVIAYRAGRYLSKTAKHFIEMMQETVEK